jgi:hypothetical protein
LQCLSEKGTKRFKQATAMNAKQINWLSSLIGLGVVAFLTACSPDTDPTPIGDQPRSGTTPPSNATTVPGSGTTTPGNDVGISLGNTRLSWSALDFQEWTHDAAGQWTRYVTQWNSVQGSTTVSRWVHDFQYGQPGRIERLTISDANRLVRYVEYQYAHTQLTQSREFSATGTLLATYRYAFDNNRLIEQSETHHVNTPRQVRKLFSYDTKGNLTEVAEFVRLAGAAAFVPAGTVQYSVYDDRPALPTQSLETYPYLPGVTFRVNNPRFKRLFDATGQPMVGNEQYAYAFGADGRAASQTISGAGGTRTGQFQYSPKW